MGLKDRLNKLRNRGPDSPAPLKSKEPASVEDEVTEITKKLDHERQTREGMGRFFKHPVKVLTEKPVNILIVFLPLSLILFVGGFIMIVRSYGISVLFKSTVVDDFAVFAVLLSIVPVAVLDQGNGHLATQDSRAAGDDDSLAGEIVQFR